MSKESNQKETTVETGGTYEIIRNRLNQQAKTLDEKTKNIN